MRRVFVLTGLLGIGLGCSIGFAQVEVLEPGDKAPSLDIAHWLMGGPVESFTPGHIYVVEFWATWCVPCIQSMPHISKIQQLYPDQVTIIGVTHEEPSDVTTFLEGNNLFKPDDEDSAMADVIRYKLASDPDKSTSDQYMLAAGIKGLPATFIVGKTGLIEWIGTPMEMDGPLSLILKDQWDRSDFNKEALLNTFWEQRDSGAFDEAAQTIELLTWLHPNSPGMLIRKLKLTLAQTGKLPATMEHVQLAIDRHWDDANYLHTLSVHLYLIYKDYRDDPQAAQLLQEAARGSARSRELGDDNLIVHTHEAGAMIAMEQGDLDMAIELMSIALEEAQPDFADDDPWVVSMRDNLREWKDQIEKYDRP